MFNCVENKCLKHLSLPAIWSSGFVLDWEGVWLVGLRVKWSQHHRHSDCQNIGNSMITIAFLRTSHTPNNQIPRWATPGFKPQKSTYLLTPKKLIVTFSIGSNHNLRGQWYCDGCCELLHKGSSAEWAWWPYLENDWWSTNLPWSYRWNWLCREGWKWRCPHRGSWAVGKER